MRKGVLDQMESALRKHYDDPASSRAISAVQLFNDDLMPAKRFHLIFCLDCSGSMSGAPWQQVVTAYNQMLERRTTDQGLEDLVSVVAFSSSVYVHCKGIGIRSAPQSIPYTGGGTRFAPAINACAQAVAAAPADATPLIIFMSDGQNQDHPDTLDAVRHMHAAGRSRNLQLHTVAFGSHVASLQEMASVAGGQYHTCQTGVDLSRTFVSIASGCGALDGLLHRFADILGRAITFKVMLDYL